MLEVKALTLQGLILVAVPGTESGGAKFWSMEVNGNKPCNKWEETSNGLTQWTEWIMRMAKWK